MQSDKELMQQALEALENAEDQLPKPYSTDAREAITDLRERLAQPERDGACRHCDGTGCVACDARHLPEQEPVAMRMPKEGDRVICIEDDSVGTVLFTSAAGGPYVKFDDGSYGQWSLREFGAGFRYANTTSPRREWVGLTEEERSYYLQTASNIGWWKAAEIIEAKLKEKNT